MLNKQNMKRVIDKIIVTGNALKKYDQFTDIFAKANLPATDFELTALKEKVSFVFPPSYLQLLSIYNGIENFEWLDVSFLSTEYQMSHDNLDEDWVESGAYCENEIYIFAQSNFDAHVVAFLLKTQRSDGEMGVVHFDSSGLHGSYNDLGDYLKEREEWFIENLKIEKADRASFTVED